MQVHLFDGYWEDIGTIRAFYQANLALAKADPPCSLASADAPIFTRARFLPPSRLDGATVRESLIADGCVICPGVVIENSVIGLRCRLGENVQVRNSILLETTTSPGRKTTRRTWRPAGPRWASARGRSSTEPSSTRTADIGPRVRAVNASGVDRSPESDQAMVVDGILVIPEGVGPARRMGDGRRPVMSGQWRVMSGQG